MGSIVRKTVFQFRVERLPVRVAPVGEEPLVITLYNKIPKHAPLKKLKIRNRLL